MSAAIKCDSRSFANDIRRLSRITGESVSKRMAKEVGVVAGSLMRAFPPKSAKAGKVAIISDMYKIFNTDENSLREFDLSIQSGFGGTEQEVRAIRTKTGAAYVVDRKLYRPYASQTEMRNHHQKYRQKDGRVTQASSGGRGVSRGDKYIGRWKSVDKMYVSKSVFDGYLKTVAKKVGYLKSGWIPAAKLNPKYKAAKWIRANQGPGGYSNRMKPNGSGYISFWNSVPYAGRSNFRSINNFVMRQNSKRLTRVIRYEYRKAIKKAGG